MEKKNLKRAIAKFEELANDEKYEGNRKIINLDAFLKSDIKKKKKKKDQILESTPIKSSKTDLDNDQLNNTFNEDDSSSSEIKTADDFLKKFISQPSFIESSSKKNKSTSSSKKNKSTSSVKNKSKSSIKDSLTKLKDKSLIKNKKSLSPSKTSTLNKEKNQLDKYNRLNDDTKRYQELKEREQHFMMRLQNANQKAIDDEDLSDEEYDDEELSDEELDDEELDDEELDDEELNDEELDDEELDEKKSNKPINKKPKSISLLAKSTDKVANKKSKAISILVKSPNNSKKLSPSKTSNEQKNQLNKRNNQLDNKLKNYQKLKESEKQFLLNLQNSNKKTADEELSDEDEEFSDEEINEEDINEIENLNDESFDDESIDPENSELFSKEQHHEHQQQLTNDEDMTDEEQFKNNQIIHLMNKNQYKQVCKLNRLERSTNQQSTSSDHYDTLDYITNYDYQRTATEELYELISKSNESSFTVLSKLIKNIKKTLDQDELPNPSNVRPFFHFTPDNQIHITFLFINPKDVYYNPWNSIITKNYSNLNILFEKIYEHIFNFNYIINKKHLYQQR